MNNHILTPTDDNQVLTFAEAMDYLRISRSTLYRLMEDGKLQGSKVGCLWRFYFNDVKACMRRESVEKKVVVHTQEDVPIEQLIEEVYRDRETW